MYDDKTIAELFLKCVLHVYIYPVRALFMEDNTDEEL